MLAKGAPGFFIYFNLTWQRDNSGYYDRYGKCPTLLPPPIVNYIQMVGTGLTAQTGYNIAYFIESILNYAFISCVR